MLIDEFGGFQKRRKEEKKKSICDMATFFTLHIL